MYVDTFLFQAFYLRRQGRFPSWLLDCRFEYQTNGEFPTPRGTSLFTRMRTMKFHTLGIFWKCSSFFFSEFRKCFRFSDFLKVVVLDIAQPCAQERFRNPIEPTYPNNSKNCQIFTKISKYFRKLPAEVSQTFRGWKFTICLVFEPAIKQP